MLEHAPAPRASRRIESLLFGVAIALPLATAIYLIAYRRFPLGHDGFSAYVTRWTALAGAAVTGRPPLWLPFSNQGAVSTLAMQEQGSFLQNVLLALAPALAGRDFLPLFHLSMLVDELFLLVGSWLLLRRWFASPFATFFVCVALTGSALWVDDPAWNFYAYYTLPLILYLMHRFVETGERWRLFAAALLLLMRLVTGNAPYNAMLTLFALVVYWGLWAVLDRRAAAAAAATLARRPRPFDLVWVAWLVASVLLLVGPVVGDMAGVHIAPSGRRPDGSSDLDWFLGYGGRATALRYLDLVLGLSFNIDYTLYCGYQTLAFALLAPFIAPRRKLLHLGLTGLAIVAFSIGAHAIAAPLAYHLVPGMSYFRHVALSAPVVRVLVILAAGFGLDRALLAPPRRGGIGIAVGAVMMAVAAMLLTGALACLLGWRPAVAIPYVAAAGAPSFAVSPDDLVNVADLLGTSALAAGVAGFIVLLWSRGARHAPFVLWLVLFIHPGEMMSWKFRMLQLRTFGLDDAQAAMQALVWPAWTPRRTRDYEANPRFRAFRRALFPSYRSAGGRESRRMQHGEIYAATDGWLGIDPVSSHFRSNYWMWPLDDLMRAYSGQPLRDRSQVFAGWDAYVLTFPDRHPSHRIVVGQDADKLRVFAGATGGLSDPEIATRLAAPDDTGGVLYLSDAPPVAGTSAGLPAPRGARSGLRPQTSRSALTGGWGPPAAGLLPASIRVVRFAADRLEVVVDVPAGHEHAWLYDAEVWDPGWRVEVNGGGPQQVRRANLAYRAVPLQRGQNRVTFYYDSEPGRLLGYRVLQAASALWLCALAAWTVRLLAGGLRPAPGSPSVP
jgi:hypothetical protein